MTSRVKNNVRKWNHIVNFRTTYNCPKGITSSLHLNTMFDDFDYLDPPEYKNLRALDESIYCSYFPKISIHDQIEIGSNALGKSLYLDTGNF